MGVRGELFSARVHSNNDRRTYFLNVKENRNKDLFLTIVESKKQEGGEEFERHQVVVFDDDLHLFQKGMERVMEFINEHRGGEKLRESRRLNRPAETPEERDDRGPRRDSRGPGRDDRGPRRDSRGPGRDDRGPRRDSRGPGHDDRGPRRDYRSSR